MRISVRDTPESRERGQAQGKSRGHLAHFDTPSASPVFEHSQTTGRLLGEIAIPHFPWIDSAASGVTRAVHLNRPPALPFSGVRRTAPATIVGRGPSSGVWGRLLAAWVVSLAVLAFLAISSKARPMGALFFAEAGAAPLGVVALTLDTSVAEEAAFSADASALGDGGAASGSSSVSASSVSFAAEALLPPGAAFVPADEPDADWLGLNGKGNSQPRQIYEERAEELGVALITSFEWRLRASQRAAVRSHRIERDSQIELGRPEGPPKLSA